MLPCECCPVNAARGRWGRPAARVNALHTSARARKDRLRARRDSDRLRQGETDSSDGQSRGWRLGLWGGEGSTALDLVSCLHRDNAQRNACIRVPLTPAPTTKRTSRIYTILHTLPFYREQRAAAAVFCRAVFSDVSLMTDLSDSVRLCAFVVCWALGAASTRVE